MDFLNDLFSTLVFNRDISILEIFKLITTGLVLYILVPVCRCIKSFYMKSKNKKENIKELLQLKIKVMDELKYIYKQLESKNLYLIITNNKLSRINIMYVSEYCVYLKKNNDNEANDYIAIENLFINSEILKTSLQEYVNTRSGGMRIADLHKDSKFSILTKNYNDLIILIDEKINKL